MLLTVGSLITLAAWVLAWTRVPLLSEYSFFPLWVGYILTINGAAEMRFKTSLLRILGKDFLWLFVASIPFWWFFEFLNMAVQNWIYHLPHPISVIHYVIESSINFSTVLPAVLSTTFLFALLLKNCKRWSVISKTISKKCLMWSFLLGVVGFCLLPLFPNETFPLVWIAPLLVLEPLLKGNGYSSVFSKIESGDMRFLISLGGATLFAGFWWECWNEFSSPFWTYNIPYVGFWKIFQMPLLGYFGYPFFGLLIYSYTVFMLCGVFDSRVGRALLLAIDGGHGSVVTAER